jgi:TRAP-type C4-dicarboxylate transport system substrate-binding protein
MRKTGKAIMSRYLTTLLLCFCLQPAIAMATVFKVATLSPEGSYWMKVMRAGADEVAQKTNNRVQIKFYPGGVMGDDPAVLRKIRIRQLQGGAITLGAVSNYYPDSQVYSLPMLFRNLEEASYVRSKLDGVILQGLEQNGFVSFGLVEGGFAYIMSLAPIQSVSQLRNSKAWVPSADELAMEAVKAYDVQPIPLPLGDVLTGLQTGLIDTVAAPPIATIALHWHTQVRYLTDMPLLYSTGLLIIEKNAFYKLSKQDQQIMREVMGRVFSEINQQNRIDNKSAFNAIQSQGIELVKPDTIQLEEWRRFADAATRQMIKSGKVSKDILQTAEKLLADFRNQQK